jgi:hypothetical protein
VDSVAGRPTRGGHPPAPIEEGKEKMRGRAALLVIAMAAALVLAAGVALAERIDCWGST